MAWGNAEFWAVFREWGTLCVPAHSYLDDMRALLHLRGA
jgi:hypothetical protein